MTSNVIPTEILRKLHIVLRSHLVQQEVTTECAALIPCKYGDSHAYAGSLRVVGCIIWVGYKKRLVASVCSYLSHPAKPTSTAL